MDTIHHSHNTPMQWADDAACHGTPGATFYPVTRKHATWDTPAALAAKAICAGCPVAADCLEWGIHNEIDGIWGGTDPHQRVAIRRQRGMNVHAAIAPSDPDA